MEASLPILKFLTGLDAQCKVKLDHQDAIDQDSPSTGRFISLTGRYFSRNQANHERKTFSLDFNSSSRVVAGFFCIRPSGRSAFGSCQILTPSLKSWCHSSESNQYIILEPLGQVKHLAWISARQSRLLVNGLIVESQSSACWHLRSSAHHFTARRLKTDLAWICSGVCCHLFRGLVICRPYRDINLLIRHQMTSLISYHRWRRS